MAGLLDLAPELHATIFLNLPFTDVCRCMLTCRDLYASICLSYELRYQMRLESAGLQDNPYCKTSIPDRFAYLQARESSWGFFQKQFLVDSPIPLKSTTDYDLTSSIYLLGKAGDGDANENLMMGIQHLKLPSLFSDSKADDTDTITWSFVNLDMHIVEIGTAIEEHDLLVCIVRSVSEEDPTVSNYTVILLRYSTMKAHDGSEKPIFSLCTATEKQGRPSIAIEVSGENLAIVASFRENAVIYELDGMYIYDWKAGRRKTDPFLVYDPALVFLREDILLNPNSIRQRFDIYYIPPSSSLLPNGFYAEVRRIHYLQLPPMLQDRFITSFSCFCRPNPTANAEFPKYTEEKRPYANNPKKAIARFDMTVRARDVATPDKFVMIVHRQALLDLVPTELIMEDSESAEKDLAVANGGNDENNNVKPNPQPWESWGPPITRWFDGSEVSSIFASTNSGQRCVQFTVSKDQLANENQQGSVRDTMHILDFNPWNVRIAHLKGLGEPQEQQPEICTITVVGARDSRSILEKDIAPPTSAENVATETLNKELEENICPGKDAFCSDVVGRLPYIRVTSGVKAPFSGVLMNEEVLIGMQFESRSYRMKTATIMYFG